MGLYDVPIAVAAVKTSRLFEWPTNFRLEAQGYIVQFNIEIKNDGVLYLTQEGGIPIFGNHTFTGTVDITLLNGTLLTIPVDQPHVWFEKSPSLAFATADTTSYYRVTNFLDSGMDVERGEIERLEKQLVISQYYIITTSQSMADTVRNYTITELRTEFILNDYYDVDFRVEGSEAPKSTEAKLIIWDQSKNLPTYIKTSEPAKFGGLRLNEELKQVEYTLVLESTDSVSKSDESDVSLLLGPIIVAILLRRKYN